MLVLILVETYGPVNEISVTGLKHATRLSGPKGDVLGVFISSKYLRQCAAQSNTFIKSVAPRFERNQNPTLTNPEAVSCPCLFHQDMSCEPVRGSKDPQ